MIFLREHFGNQADYIFPAIVTISLLLFPILYLSARSRRSSAFIFLLLFLLLLLLLVLLGFILPLQTLSFRYEQWYQKGS